MGQLAWGALNEAASSSMSSVSCHFASGVAFLHQCCKAHQTSANILPHAHLFWARAIGLQRHIVWRTQQSVRRSVPFAQLAQEFAHEDHSMEDRGGHFFDAHCHLQDPRLDGRVDEVLELASGAGVNWCAVNGTSEVSWTSVLILSCMQQQLSCKMCPMLRPFGLSASDVCLLVMSEK